MVSSLLREEPMISETCLHQHNTNNMASPIDSSMKIVTRTVTALKAKLAELVTTTDPTLLATVMGRRIVVEDDSSRELLWASAKADQGIRMASQALDNDDDLIFEPNIDCDLNLFDAVEPFSV